MNPCRNRTGARPGTREASGPDRARLVLRRAAAGHRTADRGLAGRRSTRPVRTIQGPIRPDRPALPGARRPGDDRLSGHDLGARGPDIRESTLLARAMLGNSLRNGIPGAVLVVDVRDVAAVHAVLRPGLGPRRYFAVAETVALVDLQRLIRQAAGLGPPRGMLPAGMVTLTGRAADLVQRLLRRRLPLDYEGPWTALHCPAVDATATTRGLGVAFRPAAQTILDTVRWLRTTEPAGQARPAGPHTNEHGVRCVCQEPDGSVPTGGRRRMAAGMGWTPGPRRVAAGRRRGPGRPRGTGQRHGPGRAAARRRPVVPGRGPEPGRVRRRRGRPGRLRGGLRHVELPSGGPAGQPVARAGEPVAGAGKRGARAGRPVVRARGAGRRGGGADAGSTPPGLPHPGGAASGTPRKDRADHDPHRPAAGATRPGRPLRRLRRLGAGAGPARSTRPGGGADRGRLRARTSSSAPRPAPARAWSPPARTSPPWPKGRRTFYTAPIKALVSEKFFALCDDVRRRTTSA